MENYFQNILNACKRKGGKDMTMVETQLELKLQK